MQNQNQSRTLKTKSTPLVSVIVTCHNYGRYLNDCIASLLGGPSSLGELPAQSLANIEIIIVDDASTDETTEVASKLAEQHSSITFIHRKVCGGTSAANNTGIKSASGEYFTVLCADDMREHDSLEKMYHACLSHPKHFVYDDITVFRNGARADAWPMSTYDFETCLNVNQVHCGIMAPKAAWRDVGGYPEAFSDGREDWAMAVAMGIAGWCGYHLPNAGYLYRREHQNRSLTNGSPEHQARFLAQMQAAFPNIYAGERPMSCCGGGISQSNLPQFSGQSDQGLMLGAEGMTLLQYIGGNQGNESWTGPKTYSTYVFSLSNPTAYVDNRDVDGMLALRDKGVLVFQRAPEQQPA